MTPRLRPIDIGPVRIDSPVILAPMTGVSDLPFRRMVRSYGSGLNVTEMIASQAAIRETRQSIQKALWDPSEEPVSMQLVGCTPKEMGEAAKLSQDRGAARPCRDSASPGSAARDAHRHPGRSSARPRPTGRAP